MPRFAANLSLLYPELGFLDRFAAAAADGFSGVECLFPYAFPAQLLADRLRQFGLQQVLINAPPGDWEAGERGIAALPGRTSEFREGFLQALDYAHALNCPRIHVLSGLLPANATDRDRQQMEAVFLDNLQWAAVAAATVQREVLIEPINTRDFPGYFLNRQDHAHSLVSQLGQANIKVQMDLYHCQIVEGDLATKLRHYLPTGRVGHIQIAGVPARNEPDLGELNFPYLFQLIDALGYSGWIGCEYRPAIQAEGGTSQGLAWLRDL